MKKYIRMTLVVVIGVALLWLLKIGFCRFAESCGSTHYVNHIKSVIEPLKEQMSAFYKANERYPEWDEIESLLENAGCNQLTFIDKSSFRSHRKTGKPMIDVKGRGFLYYKYECHIRGRKLRISASEKLSDTSLYTDETKRELRLKVLDSIKIRFRMGSLSICSLSLEKNISKTQCGRLSWIAWGA